MEKRKVVIGTRASALALWQAEWVKGELEGRYPDITVVLEKIKTTGDKILDVPLAKVGGKGLFVKEIEEALLDGRVDLAVHSMKDVPTFFPEGLALRVITEREDPRDAVLTRDGTRLFDLPEGAKVGTASLRRQSQILLKRPDFGIVPVRGNVGTRIGKLEAGDFDALILAGAGLNRLGLDGKVTHLLSVEESLPAIGQGALGIETKIGDDFINGLVDFLNHDDTSYAVRAERALLKHLEGGCQVPIAAFGEVSGTSITLRALVASVDGKTVIQESMTSTTDKVEELGIAVGEKLLEGGAGDILKEVYDSAE